MLTLTVVKSLGQPPNQALQGQFDESGGVVGRAPSCTLALPDPYQHISREQLRVEFQHGQFGVNVCGVASVVLLNDEELDKDIFVPVQHNDVLHVGEFELLVAINSVQLPAAEPRFSGPESPTVFWNSISGAPNISGTSSSENTGATGDPFGNLFSSNQTTNPGLAPAAKHTSESKPSDASKIPDDFDIWGTNKPTTKEIVSVNPLDHLLDPIAQKQSNARQQDDLVGTRTNENINDLFGLGAKKPTSDPFDGIFSPQQALPQDNSALGHFAPILGHPKGHLEAPLSDHVPEIQGTFQLPSLAQARQTPVAPAAPPTPLSEAISAPISPPAIVRGEVPYPALSQEAKNTEIGFKSWESDSGNAQPQRERRAHPRVAPKPATESKGKYLAPEVLKQIAERVAQDNQHLLQEPSIIHPTQLLNQLNQNSHSAQRQFAAQKAAPQMVDQTVGLQPDHDQLLQAFLKGLDLPELPRSPLDRSKATAILTPELMMRLGEVLRTSTQGVLDMLSARSLLKREMKAEVTMIVTKDNNPLKFSPDVESALTHLLSPTPIRGFLSPGDSVVDAFTDLNAHQMAFVAGVRAATTSLVEKFDPASLEMRLTKKTVIESVIPATRKAKLWERFNELYTELSAEAHDDFDTFFGREFLKAYEEQIELLDQSKLDVSKPELNKKRS